MSNFFCSSQLVKGAFYAGFCFCLLVKIIKTFLFFWAEILTRYRKKPIDDNFFAKRY